MERRIIGIMLSLFGFVCFIIAGINCIDDGTDIRKMIISFGIIGIISIFAGILTIKTSRHKHTDPIRTRSSY